MTALAACATLQRQHSAAIRQSTNNRRTLQQTRRAYAWESLFVIWQLLSITSPALGILGLAWWLQLSCTCLAASGHGARVCHPLLKHAAIERPTGCENTSAWVAS